MAQKQRIAVKPDLNKTTSAVSSALGTNQRPIAANPKTNPKKRRTVRYEMIGFSSSCSRAAAIGFNIECAEIYDIGFFLLFML